MKGLRNVAKHENADDIKRLKSDSKPYYKAKVWKG